MSIGKHKIFKFKDITANKQQILETMGDFYKELYRNRQNKNNLDSSILIKSKLINEDLEDLLDIIIKIKNALKRNGK
jgi:hypothetical protein